MTKEHKSLEVDNFANLANKEYEHIDPLIKNFLPGVGLFLFCGGLKVGKSLMALDIGSHICTGLPFWGYEVRQADVLYLCLEDGEERLQDRMFTIASECSENFYYAIEASALEDDLIEQLQEQKDLHPDLGLIIIDTLAAIRSEQNASNGNAYLADYKILNSLHEFAQENHIAVLVIHHVRKMKSSEPFDDISGTNGLFGSADGAYVFRKEREGDSTAKLYMKGRDLEARVLTLEFDKSTLKWLLVSESSVVEDDFQTDPDLKKTVEYLKEHGSYYGRVSEFCELISAKKPPQSLSGKLYARRRELDKMGIYFERTRGNKGAYFDMSYGGRTNLPDPYIPTQEELAELEAYEAAHPESAVNSSFCGTCDDGDDVTMIYREGPSDEPLNDLHSDEPVA